MKIKKIPFPDVLKVLCFEIRNGVTFSEGVNRWNIWIQHRVNEGIYHFYMTWYCNDIRMWVSDELDIYDTAAPDKVNPLIREWYEKTCIEMQKIFDNFVKENFLEESNYE